MKAALPKLIAGTLEPRRQDESRASEWPGRNPEDGRIDLHGSVADAECLVRAVTRPYPGAFFERDGRRIIVWKAAIAASQADCGSDRCLAFSDGWLRCLEWEDSGPV